MKGSLKVLMVVMASMVLATAAMAQTSPVNSSGQVDASVSGRCVVDTQFAIDFGAYDPFAATADVASSAVVYRCTKGVTTHNVKLANSGNMTGATNGESLPYTIHKSDPSTADDLFPTTGVAGTGTAGVAGGYTLDVWGKIATGQDVSVDTYNATHTFTLNW